MDRPATRHGFTLIEVLVIAMILMVLVAILLPTLGYMRRENRRMQNNTQLREIHQGMVVAAQDGRRVTTAGYFPGTHRNTGEIFPDGSDTGHSGEGSVPAARLCQLLNGRFFPPDHLVSPADRGKTVATPGPRGEFSGLTSAHHSYAMLTLLGTANERAEWRETLNSDAVVLSDRAIGTDDTDLSSVWTQPGSGTWSGGVVRNDNRTSHHQTHIIENTQYGEGDANALDDLFADDLEADDAFLVHEDAVTAYSAE